MKIIIYLYEFPPPDSETPSNHGKNIKKSSTEGHLIIYLISFPQNCQGYQKA